MLYCIPFTQPNTAHGVRIHYLVIEYMKKEKE